LEIDPWKKNCWNIPLNISNPFGLQTLKLTITGILHFKNAFKAINIPIEIQFIDLHIHSIII
jgi:hypothetical protein